MASPLNSSQVLILQTLAKAPRGLTTDQLKAKSKGACNSGNLGPVFRDVLSNYPDSLYARGLVRCRRGEGESATWEATPKGHIAAEECRTRVRPDDAIQVPAAIIDPAVRTFMPTRTYGLEIYTDDDMTEIRDELGADYATANLDDLRMQIVNRRKQGAFQNPDDRLRKKLEQFQRFLAEHELELTESSSAKLSKLLMRFAG